MMVELGANLLSVGYLAADTVDASTEDAVVVDGQENLEAEEDVTTDELVEDGSEDVTSDGTEGESADAESVTATEDAVVDGEEVTSTDEVDVADGEEAAGDEAVDGAETSVDEMTGGSMDMMEGTTEAVKDPMLSNPVFVGGVSLAVLVVGGVLGFILAKKKIKKGIEIYEDI